jgi:hypothetical protein
MEKRNTCQSSFERKDSLEREDRFVRVICLKRLSGNTGQALPEYVVGVMMIMLALFAPIPAFDDQSAVELLTSAFQKNYRGYEYVMSQPSND